MNDSRLIELAIEGLQAKRRSIDEELAQLQTRLGGRGAGSNALPKPPAKAAAKGRRKRTAAQRKAHSERMKKIWADRRKAKK